MQVVPFSRSLGAQSGVQLLQIVDGTGDRFAGDLSDQTAATVGRFERGRIDRSFIVERTNLYRLLGQPSSTLISRLNETFVHAYEALSNGAQGVAISRLVPAGATNSYMVCKSDPVAANVWSVAAAPGAGYAFAVKHLECFNEGVRIAVNALDNAGQPSMEVKLRMFDKTSGAQLFEFAGSLDPAAKDEFGTSRFLPNVVSSLTDLVEVVVAPAAAIAATATFYGVDAQGADKWEAKVLTPFNEGGTAYADADYDAALNRLQFGQVNFGYLMAGGTRSVSLLTKLLGLGRSINKQVAWDIPGDLTPAAAITFYNQIGNTDSLYSQCYWAPLRHDDPVNGGKDYIGRSCVNVGLRCARNAKSDGRGIAPKQYVVAGYEWPLSNSGIVQSYTPSEAELSNLAKSRINPVMFVRYASGSRFVFYDSLTGAKTDGDRKLIAVAEMATSNDDYVTTFAQQCLQLPMQEAVARTTRFMKGLFEAEETAGWLVPTIELEGAAFAFEVSPNAKRPKDRMDIRYRLSYEGTARVIYVEQTISK